MSRSLRILASVLIGSGAVLTLLLLTRPPRPAPGHRPLHIGCPPGSHGKPRHAGAGAALQRARSGQSMAGEELSNRALTAGHPGRADAPTGSEPDALAATRTR